LFFLFFLYLVLVTCVYSFRWWIVRMSANLFQGGDIRLGISLTWAWAPSKVIHSRVRQLDAHDFNLILHKPMPKASAMLNPGKLLVCLSVVAYQIAFRGYGLISSGYCRNTPNCSNFMLGCLFRYSILEAFHKAYTRYDNCCGTYPITFDEKF